MIDAIIHFSIKNKLIIGLFVLALIAWGIYSFNQIPIDAVPDITNNQVQVITQSPSLAAQEVEQFITFPLETSLRNIPGVIEIRSISRFGLSVITVVFTDDTDTYLARQLVAEQIKMAEEDIMPGVGTPAMAPVTTGLGEIYQYVIRPEKGYEQKYTATDLRTVQDWIVKRQLAGVPGVVEVSSFGGFMKEYEVSINPEKLRAMNTTIPEIYQALAVNNANTGGSYIEKGSSAYFIRGEGMVNNLQDISQIVVKNIEGIPILVSDLADVKFGHAVRYGAMTRNGQGEVVGGIVLMLKGASSEAVINGVKERVAQIQKTLPAGLIIEPFLDRTTLIDKAIRTVSTNLIEGGLIVIFVLILLLGNWRAGIVVASVIPLCMLFALSMLNVFGISANLMSLGAIDFGLVVDGAVIIVEAMIFHIAHAQHNGKNETMDDIAQDSASKMMRSALFGQLIILIVYFPILSLTGIEGKMFRPMAMAVSFAIIGAMILCVTYVPMASALLLTKNIKEEGTLSHKIMHSLHKVYDPIIRLALKRRLAVIGIAVLLFLGSLLIFFNMGGEFIPNLDEGDFAVEVRLAPGSSLSQTIKVSTDAENILLKFPEVKQVISKIGTAEIPTDPMPLEANDLMVILKEKDDWTSADSKDGLAEKMSAALSVIPGVNFDFQQPIQMRFNELMTGVKSDVAVKIYGEDLNILFQKANQSAALLRNIEGVADLKVEQIIGLPQMLVTYQRDKIAQYGVNIADLNMILKTAFAGETAGVVFEGEKRFDLVVRLNSAFRTDIENIRNLYIELPNGNKVPFGELADIAYKEAPMQISRDNARRRITVGLNVRNRDVESLVGEIRQVLEKKVELPTGYYFTYGGQFENLQNAKARLSIAVPVSLLLIFVLLFFTFHSFKQSLMIYTAIPLSAIGGILALWLRDMPFSISAGVGFIALFGVAVLNGIVLISYFNDLEKEGVTDVYERILKGTTVRFRPVVMTAAVASLGFLPMALSGSAGAEVQRPLATVVIGGLISATLLTLVVLPVLYSFFSKENTSPTNIGTTSSGVNPVAIGLLILGSVGLISFPAKAQNNRSAPQMISLSQAVDLALQQNPLLRLSSLEVESQRNLRKTAFDIPKTSVEYQYGQIQAMPNDYLLNVTQQFAFPTQYAAQRKLSSQQITEALRRRDVQKNELVRQVKSVYYRLLQNYARKQLLQQQDSLYQRSAQAAAVRYRTGETNQLEQISAETRARDIRNSQILIISEIEILRQQLQILLNQPQPIVIDTLTTPVKMETDVVDLNGLTITNNPVLAVLEQQAQVSKQVTRLEKQKLLPDFSVGYFNQSIEKVPGFNAVQAGIALPLFFAAPKGRIEAARIGEDISRTQLAYQTTQLSGELQMLKQQLLSYTSTTQYYESYALPQADLILRNAEQSYRSGEIDYVNFVQEALQAWQIKESYLDQLEGYNQTVIAIEAISGITQQ